MLWEFSWPLVVLSGLVAAGISSPGRGKHSVTIACSDGVLGDGSRRLKRTVMLTA
ncbi:hypothetical protein Droror1_Dr00024623, partial [Drosera rotundifolia]